MRNHIRKYLILLGLILLVFTPMTASKSYAQETTASKVESFHESPVQPALVSKIAVIAGIAILPYVIMLLTSFLKMVVVLSLLRQALGVQNSPPNQVINGMALLMAIYVMFPTALAMYKDASGFIDTQAPKQGEIFSTESAQYMIGVAEKMREPMRKFLTRNSLTKHRTYFYRLAKQKFPPEFQKELTPSDFIVLIPAYITSQVKGAFEIGVLIYLPFFVIDLVTSNILLAMGMMMLSPLTIALPLKLLLLVMIDGWTLVVEGVVLSYR